ncbi:hypothetical protein XENOCAPTIV_021757, partial [Xenoophorus captivus]
MRAAASNPVSSYATVVSPRLAAAPPMPSLLAPARCCEATPDELEQHLRFYARQIKSFRRTSLLYSSPEFRERIRQMEEDYKTAVRQFYCRPPSPTPSHQSDAAEPSKPGLPNGAAAQSTSGLQEAGTEQPTSEYCSSSSSSVHVMSPERRHCAAQVCFNLLHQTAGSKGHPDSCLRGPSLCGSCLGPCRTPGPSLCVSCLGPSRTPGPSLRRGLGNAADLRTPRFVSSSGLAAGPLTNLQVLAAAGPHGLYASTPLSSASTPSPPIAQDSVLQ